MGHAARRKQHEQQTRRATPGTIAVIASELGRYTVFHQCFSELTMPPGTHTVWMAGTVDISASRNYVADAMLGDWLLMIDDDQCFRRDMLMRLLGHLERHPDVDIVAPLIVRKKAPYETVCCRRNEHGAHEVITLTPDMRGFRDVSRVGTGVMLIRRRVFERLSSPWFVDGTEDELGRRLSHDVAFCDSARRAGLRVCVDFDYPVGHLTTVSVWPKRLPDGQWSIAFHNAPATSSPRVAEHLEHFFADSAPTARTAPAVEATDATTR